MTQVLSVVTGVLSCLWGAAILKKEKKAVKPLILLGLMASLPLGNLAFGYTLSEVLFLSVLLVSVVTDTHSGELHALPLYLLLPIALTGFYSMGSYISAIFIILIFLYKKNRLFQYYFGEGDLFILLAISMMYGADVFNVLVYGSFTALAYCFFFRTKEAYFVPFLYIGLFLSRIEAVATLSVF